MNRKLSQSFYYVSLNLIAIKMNISSKEVALIVCFAALYVVVSFVPLFKLVGGEGIIAATSVISLVIGLILGPLLGGLAVLIGGIIAPFVNPQIALGFFASVPHIAAAVCVGALKNEKQPICVLIYLFSFIFFAFFPYIGPVWIWPWMLWFHIISLLIMASPLQTKAIKNVSSPNPTSLTTGVIVTFLTSTLFSQVVGSIVFEFLNIGNISLSYWLGEWQSLTLIYPVERLIIVAIATVIAVPVLKALRIQGFKV